MAGVNKFLCLGRLGDNPAISYTQSGMAVCKFSLATSRKQKNGNEVTQWHRCTAWDKAGELIAKYVTKGQMLYIEGEINYSKYQKDGVEKYSTDIMVREFNFVGDGGGQNQSKPNSNPNPAHNQGNQNSNYQGNNQGNQNRPTRPEDIPDLDIPF